MVNTLNISASDTLHSTANTTQYWPVFSAVSIGNAGQTTTETQVQILLRSAGVLSNMWIRLTANSISATPSVTIRSRITAANGNQVVTPGTSATGTFADTTHTDTISSGNKVDISTVPGATTGTFTMSLNSFIFAANTGSITKLGCAPASVSTGLLTPATVIYNTVAGDISAGNYGTETTGAKCRQQVAGTFQNMVVNVSNNTISANSTNQSRVSGANGNIVATITASLTGFYEDTTHTDVITSGSDYDTVLTVGGTGTSMTATNTAIDFSNSNGYCQMIAAADAQTGLASATTDYFGLGGCLFTLTTESQYEGETNAAFTFSNLTTYIGTNTIAATSTLKLRANAATPTSGPSISIGSTATGEMADTTHTYAAAATDEVDTQLVVGTSSTHTIAPAWIAIWGSLPLPVIFLDAWVPKTMVIDQW